MTNEIDFLIQAAEYLRTEYNEHYDFEPFSSGKELFLLIKYDGMLCRIILMDNLRIVYLMWLDKSIIRERNQYTWQKELIDIIEGS